MGTRKKKVAEATTMPEVKVRVIEEPSIDELLGLEAPPLSATLPNMYSKVKEKMYDPMTGVHSALTGEAFPPDEAYASDENIEDAASLGLPVPDPEAAVENYHKELREKGEGHLIKGNTGCGCGNCPSCLRRQLEDGIITINEYSQKMQVHIGTASNPPKRAEKDLAISEVRGAKARISDLNVYGDGDTFALLCKASSQSQGWMKSTKVCNVPGGCIVQVTTQQRNPDGSYAVAEALTYVPGVWMDAEQDPRRLVVCQ